MANFAGKQTKICVLFFIIFTYLHTYSTQLNSTQLLNSTNSTLLNPKNLLYFTSMTPANFMLNCFIYANNNKLQLKCQQNNNNNPNQMFNQLHPTNTTTFS